MENLHQELNSILMNRLCNPIETNLKVGWGCRVEILLEIPLEIETYHYLFLRLNRFM